MLLFYCHWPCRGWDVECKRSRRGYLFSKSYQNQAMTVRPHNIQAAVERGGTIKVWNDLSKKQFWASDHSYLPACEVAPTGLRPCNSDQVYTQQNRSIILYYECITFFFLKREQSFHVQYAYNNPMQQIKWNSCVCNGLVQEENDVLRLSNNWQQYIFVLIWCMNVGHIYTNDFSQGLNGIHLLGLEFPEFLEQGWPLKWSHIQTDLPPIKARSIPIV